MLVWKLVVIWLFFSCIAVAFLSLAMKRVGREVETGRANRACR